jgi:PAS domain S-box-containing protein
VSVKTPVKDKEQYNGGHVIENGHKNEMFYKSIFSQSCYAIIVHDIDGNILEVNSKAVEIFKYSPKEFSKINIKKLHTDYALPACKRAYDKIKSEKYINFETDFMKSNGDIFSAEVHSSLVDINGTPVVHGFIIDITDKKRMHETLIDIEDRYHTILENSPIGICITDRDGRYKYVNPKMCEIYGFTQDSFINNCIWDVLERPNYSSDRKKIYQQRFDKGEPLQLGELEYYDSNKNNKWIHYTCDFIKENGKPKYLISMSIDITEHKKSELAHRKIENTYKSMFDTFLDFYFQADLKGKLITVSPSSLQLSGYTPDELTGRHVQEFFPDQSHSKKFLMEILKNGIVHDFESTLRDKNYRNVPVSINGKLIRDENNKPLRIEGTFRDIQKRKLAEDNLKEREILLKATIE